MAAYMGGKRKTIPRWKIIFCNNKLLNLWVVGDSPNNKTVPEDNC